MHVGDHYYADIMGARSVGITPVLLDRKGTLGAADCLVVNDLGELCDYLRGH
jgi:putative hydrolase of the HAD superfamily